MTPEQAKQRWCPFSVVRDKDAGTATNRLTGRDDQCLCIADGCMAWRGTPQAGYCGLAGKDPPP
jgi:hypothetical protein